MDRSRVHTGVIHSHDAAKDALGCDSSGSGPVERIDNSLARHEVDDLHSAAQNAMGSDSSGSEEKEDTGYVHTSINDAYSAVQDILGCDPSEPAVEREDNGSSVSVHSNTSLLSADEDLLGNSSSGPVDREEDNPNGSNDSHTVDEDALSRASSEPVDRQDSNSVDVDGSDSAQASEPENSGDGNYIHTETND